MRKNNQQPKIMFKHTIPFFIRLIAPMLVWKVKTKEKAVFLTFDDGPHPQITPWVLQQLEKYQAKGTFFCVGENAEKYPETVKMMREQQHQIGNHTHTHISGWNSSKETYLENIEHCNQLTKSRLFRPPYGRINPWHIAAVKKKGYQIVMWTILTRDYEDALPIKKALRAILKNTKSGSILVFHDSEKAEAQLKQLLPEVLEELGKQGYSFAPIAQNYKTG
jgi:peptidoglycan-N-acetylglucosamine deacetylase